MDPRLAFKPKLISVLKEGYGWGAFGKDALAGATVAVVALPLSMAIAIACGLPPETGLVTAVAGGLVVSAVGGSRFQIGGPAGAFIVPVAGTLAAHGVKGLVLATFLSGLLLVIAGALRLGRFARLISQPVVLGFSLAIALIIAASQLHDALGLRLAGAEPAALLPRLAALAGAIGTISPAATALAAGTMLAIIGLRRLHPGMPAMLLAVAGASVVAGALHLPVETLGDRFSELEGRWPPLALPELSLASIVPVLPSALSFTLLGAIESLLSATVADTMAGRAHRPEAELVAQGLANIAASLFGGFCVTGTIARTATNIRAGAHGPVAGVLHALFVLVAFLTLMPIAAHIPFAALAGVLLLVAWGMVERHELALTWRGPRGGVVALMVTLLVVALVDLMAGIVAGTLVWLLARRLEASRPKRPATPD